MSQENVEILRGATEAFNRGDPEAWVAVLAPEFEYTASGAVVGIGGTYRGAEGFRRFLASFWDEFDEPNAEIRDLIEAGDQVLAAVSFRGRGKQSGIAAAGTFGSFGRCEKERPSVDRHSRARKKPSKPPGFRSRRCRRRTSRSRGK